MISFLLFILLQFFRSGWLLLIILLLFHLRLCFVFVDLDHILVQQNMVQAHFVSLHRLHVR